ncbi:hypothetical protein Val02_90640 [Virgisporangium aliadipatigenens]|uniref:DUF7455 domain-containing protein n=1 Tax=Virgisporangium aliadipatigenens TaxID=741659 RepID=A0A8J3YYZ8_9ACTN|nr:hypothetical protein [Virgisporangium aliadipatigenens]GIJ52178.1 hypothetical protein Val02_90640 [Virgisporangium aliadipatigenens]
MTQSMATRATVTVAAELTDRCDRCGAAGKVKIGLAGGGELTFCGHHANRFADGIGTAAERVVVESGFGWKGAQPI